MGGPGSPAAGAGDCRPADPRTRLSDRQKLDLIVCDTTGKQVLALKPYESPPSWRVLGPVGCPAHAEVVDLDGDGIPDVLVADLGSFQPTNARVGSVVWLRGRPD